MLFSVLILALVLSVGEGQVNNSCPIIEAGDAPGLPQCSLRTMFGKFQDCWLGHVPYFLHRYPGTDDEACSHRVYEILQCTLDIIPDCSGSMCPSPIMELLAMANITKIPEVPEDIKIIITSYASASLCYGVNPLDYLDEIPYSMTDLMNMASMVSLEPVCGNGLLVELMEIGYHVMHAVRRIDSFETACMLWDSIQYNVSESLHSHCDFHNLTYILPDFLMPYRDFFLAAIDTSVVFLTTELEILPTCREDNCTKYCQNSGECYTNFDGEEVCICAPGFSGDECQDYECPVIESGDLTGLPMCSEKSTLTKFASCITNQLPFETGDICRNKIRNSVNCMFYAYSSCDVGSCPSVLDIPFLRDWLQGEVFTTLSDFDSPFMEQAVSIICAEISYNGIYMRPNVSFDFPFSVCSSDFLDQLVDAWYATGNMYISGDLSDNSHICRTLEFLRLSIYNIADNSCDWYNLESIFPMGFPESNITSVGDRLSLAHSYFREWIIPTCQGPCAMQSCFNGGYCYEYNGTAFCHCASGYAGANCENEVSTDLCASFPCINNGSCYDYDMGYYYCYCPPGFTGRQCETDLSGSCDSYPCLHNGSCYDSGYGYYECYCPPGYTGYHCEISDSGLCDSNPCLNYGTCYETGYGYYGCYCPPGYTGYHCEISVSGGSCDSNPCLNYGSCIDYGYGHYECACPPGYTGYHCEVSDTDDEFKNCPMLTEYSSKCEYAQAYTCSYVRYRMDFSAWKTEFEAWIKGCTNFETRNWGDDLRDYGDLGIDWGMYGMYDLVGWDGFWMIWNHLNTCLDTSGVTCTVGERKCVHVGDGCSVCVCPNGKFRNWSKILRAWSEERNRFEKIMMVYRHLKDQCTRSTEDDCMAGWSG